MDISNTINKKSYNIEFASLLQQYAINTKSFKSSAYKKAAQTILNFPEPIYHPDQLSACPGIGKSIREKITEHFYSGKTISISPAEIFTQIYGIGSVKANDLVDKGFTTIEQLRENPSVLNEKQRIGLQYYEALLQRIPREEIDHYVNLFHHIAPNIQFEIVGSYRRGCETSGDIDVIIKSDNDNDFIEVLLQKGLLIEILARGNTKCMGISQLPGCIPRRIDFLFTSVKEYPFAVLYFTGSKDFNTFFRSHANDIGYSINEHTITSIHGTPIDHTFLTEEDIFAFVGLDYIEPIKREHFTATSEITKKTEIIQLLKKADHAYYNENEPIMTDQKYDILREKAKTEFPDDTYFSTIGSTPTTNKTKLPVFMGSMNKIKPDTSLLSNWKTRFKGPYLISCKLDGVSGLYVKNIDGTSKLYTRGNGEYGQDISHIIPYIHFPNNAYTSNKPTIIRGEFIINKKLFKEKYSASYSNSRNLVAGLINTTQTDQRFYDIQFIAYEVISPSFKPSEQFAFLTNGGYHVVHNFCLDQITNEQLSHIFCQLHQDYSYHIDGLIVTDNHTYPRNHGNPEHSFAFKMMIDDQIIEATVTNVLWTPSKNGYLKPRIQIEPTMVGNVKITYTNGFNAAYIRDNHIGIGAKLRLVRSGDVIPHIIDVIQPSDTIALPPTNQNYHWTESGVDIVLNHADENATVRIKQITLFFKKIGVEELSEGNIQRIIHAGFDTIPKITHMKIPDFLSVNGFQDKMATKLYHHIKDKLAIATIQQLMVASSIFNRGFSTHKIQLIFDTYPSVLTQKISADDIATIKGMSIQSATAFIDKIPAFLHFLHETTDNAHTRLQPIQQPYTNKLFVDKHFVFTGFRNIALAKNIENHGGTIHNTISQKISFVLCKNLDATNQKIQYATKLQIPILTMDQFIENYNIIV